jgi:hypothetical protein
MASGARDVGRELDEANGRTKRLTGIEWQFAAKHPPLAAIGALNLMR